MISVNIVIIICITRGLQAPVRTSSLQEKRGERQAESPALIKDSWCSGHRNRIGSKRRTLNHHLQSRNKKQLLEMLPKWIVHLRLLKLSHQTWLLWEWMKEFQVTVLIQERLYSCPASQQGLGNVQPEVPTMETTTS